MTTAKLRIRADWTVMLIALAAGCTHDRPLNVQLNESVVIPPRPAVIFFVDGFQYAAFDRGLARGDLPNINKYLVDRGTRVEYAFSCVPSITYAVMASFLTGVGPGRHGITGNAWFDRMAGEYRSYSFIKTYQMAGQDCQAANLFELIGPELRTVSIQLPNRRGVARPIDNWATSGINWFFGGYREVDKLVAMRLENVAAEANRWGPWPGLIFAYFPGSDEIGHRFGPDSPQYRSALRNVDAQIGRMCEAMQRVDILEKTTLVLVSDHGMAREGKTQPIGSILRRTCRDLLPRVVDSVSVGALAGEAWDRQFGRADAVVLVCGNRTAYVYLRCPDETWRTGGYRDQRSALAIEVCRRADLATLPSVALLALRAGVDRAIIANRRGRAEILRDRRTEPYLFAYRPMEGDPLDYRSHPKAAPLADGWHTDQQWLAATAESEFPDFVPQIVGLFDSDRAGDIILFAEEGWGFAPGNRGGHGSLSPTDMRVPMVWAGPEVAKNATIRYARDLDVMPTVLDLMGLGDRLKRCDRLDGRSRREELSQAKLE